MFENAEIGNSISKEDYEQRVPELRVDLINAQYELKDAGFSVVILIMGDDRLATEQVVDILNEWMDARYMATHVLEDLTQEEAERPRFWRYWRALPANGQSALFVGSWALNAVAGRLTDELDEDEFETRIEHIRTFEKEISDDGTLLLKFWLHLSKDEYKKRLKKAEKGSGLSWQLTSNDWEIYENYDRIVPVATRFLKDTGDWIIVESSDAHYRDLTVGQLIRDAIVQRLANPHQAPPVSLTPVASEPALDSVDLSATLEKSEYRERLAEGQQRLRELSLKAAKKGVATVLAFEGWDAGGKGGAIRRLTQAMPARLYRVIPVAAPTDEEKAHHYLWRFWRYLPRAGHMVIFDRTWYGRVMVERVESFAKDPEWQRAYNEINDFESQLVEHGMVFAKFWLHIDPDEQLARFKAREVTPYKKHKITDEDYRNREKWEDYITALNEAIARTSTTHAPWHLVAANDKRAARIQVLETVCAALKKRL